MALQVAQILVQAKEDIYQDKTKVTKRVPKGKKCAFRLYTTTPLREVMEKIARDAWKVPREILTFEYLGTSITETDTLQTLNLHEGDIIHVRHCSPELPFSSLSQDLRTLLSSGEGADFYFKVGNPNARKNNPQDRKEKEIVSMEEEEEDERDREYQEIPVHRCLLRLRSEKLRGLFNGSMKESKIGFASIPHHRPKTFLYMLDYLYTDELNSKVNSKEDAWKLLILADEYLLPRLVRMCELRLLSLINEENAAELHQCADQYGLEDLKNACKQIMLQQKSPLFS